MTVSTSTQIPKTSDPAVFQRQCKVLFEHVLQDPNVQEFGSSGQSQFGIDLLGRRRNLALDHWVGIQCKLTIKSKKLKKGTVKKEGKAALAFEPKLKELIVVTTADDDALMHSEAASFTDEQARLGRDFTVQVWGWQTLLAHILQYEKAVRAFSPDAFPHLRTLEQGQESLKEQIQSVGTGQVEILAALERIEHQRADVSAVLVRSTVWDDSTVGSLLDRQIDKYRDMLRDGQPRTALGLLESLWGELPENVEGRIRFRVWSNIAACKLRMGDEKTAARGYLDAYEYAPGDMKAVALKVLGLYLLDQPAEAWEFGEPFLSTPGDRAPLVAHMVLTARHLSTAVDIFEMIPSEVMADPVVELALIEYLRSLPDDHLWIKEAREALARHPEDRDLARMAAEGEISDACNWHNENAGGVLPEVVRDRVIRAVATNRAEWDRVYNAEASWEGFAVCLCSNLSTGYRLLNDPEEARKVLIEGLQRVPESQDLKEALFIVALESNDPEVARAYAKDIQRTRDTIVGLHQISANAGDWKSIESLADGSEISALEIEDRALLMSLRLLAKFKLNKSADYRGEVADLLEKFEDQAVVPIILHEIPRGIGDANWARELFNLALDRSESLNRASRVMLAKVAELEDEFGSVIDLLHGHIDTARDTEELRMLSRAFVNSRVRTSTLEFIDALPATLCSLSFYARVIGSIHFNSGNLGQAASAFESAIRIDPTDLVAHFGLLNTWMRQDKKDLIKEKLDAVDPHQLVGPPTHKMGLAHLLVAYGRANVGLAFGYETVQKNRDDLHVAQLYIGLILPNPTSALIPSVGPSVEIDCWVRLRGGGEQTLEIVIEDGPDRPSIDHYSPGHALAKAVLGHKPKDIVTLSAPIGASQSWTVVEVKHKFVALLHEILQTLRSRFPEAQGLYTFEVKGDDVTPVLDHVKRQFEHEEQVLKMYTQKGFPLGFAAKLVGRTSIEFAGNLPRRKAVVRTCVGTLEERSEALKRIQGAVDNGLVLDTYTAWTAYSLGLLPALKSAFNRLALPQSSIDELIEWREQYRLSADDEAPMMTIGYMDGTYFREEIPAERVKESIATISEGISSIQREMEILPSIASSAPSQVEPILQEAGTGNLLDPIYISKSEGLLLVSEDMHYRGLANSEYSCAGAWLQPTLMVVVEAGYLSTTDYALAIAGLAIRKHDYIALSSETLLEIARADSSAKMEQFKATVAFVCGQSADPSSHLAVVWKFLRGIFRIDVPRLRRYEAANAMLERAVPFLSRYDKLISGYKTMLDKSANQPLLRDYLVQWARGHFIDVS